MKLVDILARELKEWPEMPEGGDSLEQDYNNGVIEGGGCGTCDLFMLSERADDQTFASVTRAQWQAAVDALKVGSASAWVGVGLPPVGTVCEIAPPYRDHGSKVRVLCHDEGDAICRLIEGDELGDIRQYMASEVRPIRTLEQIVAEERAAAIEDMWNVYWQPDAPTAKQALGLLWDAGYRKQEDK